MQAQTDVNAGGPRKYTARSDRNVQDEPKIRGDGAPGLPTRRIEQTHVTSSAWWESVRRKWYVRTSSDDPR